jgi:hypothetical protein
MAFALQSLLAKSVHLVSHIPGGQHGASLPGQETNGTLAQAH